MEKEENREKGIRWSWTRNQMGNPNFNQRFKMRNPFAIILSVLLPFVAAHSPAQSIIISDGTFAPGNWSQYMSGDSVAGSTVGFNQVLSGGDPDSYLAVNYAVPQPGILNFITFDSAQSYSPLVNGEIESISFSASLESLSGNTILFFGVLQNNTMYYQDPPPFLTPGSAWMNANSSASSSQDFSQPGLQTQPNFINGGPIEFGLVYSTQGGISPGSFGLDNFTVEVTSVPEPSSVVLTTWGMISLLLYFTILSRTMFACKCARKTMRS
jgi:hypothetical protein